MLHFSEGFGELVTIPVFVMIHSRRISSPSLHLIWNLFRLDVFQISVQNHKISKTSPFNIFFKNPELSYRAKKPSFF